jgi:hypothetical protein
MQQELVQLKFIKENLSGIIKQVIVGTVYTEDWLAAIARRETGQKMIQLRNQGLKPAEIWPRLKGDFSKRKGEAQASYHGFGVWQMDIASFPDFCKGEDWKNPLLCGLKAIKVLEGKRAYLAPRVNISAEDLNKAITAAFNTGEGNVRHSIEQGRNVDYTTYGGDYSADIWKHREMYLQLP